jgi:hypothetical protein
VVAQHAGDWSHPIARLDSPPATATLPAVHAGGRRRFLRTAICATATAIGAAGCRQIVGASPFTLDVGSTGSLEGGADAWPDIGPGVSGDIGAEVSGDTGTDASGDIGPPPTDFYVNPAAPDADATYPTIAQALVAAYASSATLRTIHVAAGTYTADTGESFPIILRDGVSLVGTDDGDAGPETILSGVGPVEVPIPPDLPATMVYATIWAGDAAKRIRISHLNVWSPFSPATITAGLLTVGIACDQGVTGQLDAGSPNTQVDDLDIHGFAVGLYVTYGSSGCAARVTRTTIHDGYFGVRAESPAPESQHVSLQLGDLLGNGNTFVALRLETLLDSSLYYSGSGLRVGDGVASATVLGNQFRDSEQGIWIKHTLATLPPAVYDVERNDFGFLDNNGVLLEGPSVIEPLADNTFHDITTFDTPPPNAAPYLLGTGLILQPSDTSAVLPMFVARGNSFVDNDVGFVVRQVRADVVPKFTELPDFGSALEPGRNIFHCNSYPYSGSSGDVWIHLPGAGPVTMPFEGNVWDHAPPAGDDLILDAPTGVQVDTANASSTAVMCGPPHQP